VIETPEEFRRRIGRIDFGPSLEFSSRGDVIGQFVVSLLLSGVLVGVPLWLLWPVFLPVLIGLAAFAVYCALAFFIRAHPNHDHVTERFGGLEYKLSDDINRALVVLVILLAPGRFISTGIVDGVRLMVSGRLPHEPPKE
jgi:hypothetical protein